MKAGAQSQLLLKLAYKGDTLAAFGKVNHDKQIEFIHTTVLTNQEDSKLYINETFPDQSINRMFSINNGIKGNMVIEIEHYSESKFSISIKDFDWNTGKSLVYSKVLFQDGVEVAEYSHFRRSQGKSHCEAGGEGDASAHFFNYDCRWLQSPYELIAGAVAKMIEDLKNSGESKIEEIKEIEWLQNLQETYKNIFSSTKDKIEDYKTEKEPLKGNMKELEEVIQQRPPNKPSLILVLDESQSDINFNESTDSEIKLVFKIKDAITNLPYLETKFVEVKIKAENSEYHPFWTVRASVEGTVSFSFDPKNINEYKNHNSLVAKWGFSDTFEENPNYTTISLEWDNCDYSTFTDPRDGKTYKIVQIGDQTWFAENLNYETGNSWCFNNNAENCSTYGRLYDYNTAKTACPGGWRLPSDAEWTTLTNYLGGEAVAGGKMKSISGWQDPNIDATNSSCFNALPGGMRDPYSTNYFVSLGLAGRWWSSTESSGTQAFYRFLGSADGRVTRFNYDKTLGLSCRCIKD